MEGVHSRPEGDRRTQRTRSLLTAAFVELILDRGYEELTVEDVAKKANVGRSTFYIHFKSKEDLLKQSMERPSSFLAAIVGDRLDPQALVGILNHFREQKIRNVVFFRDPVRGVWVRVLAMMIEKRLVLIARANATAPRLPLPFSALQIAEMQIAMLSHWLTGRTHVSPAAIASALVAGCQALVPSLLACDFERQFIPGDQIRISQPAGAGA